MARIVKGDEVLVISGNDRGKTGKVLAIFPEKQRVIVEGVNFIKRHTRPSQKNPQGGVVEREAAVHLSNVMPYDSGAGRGTRVRSRTLSDGKRVRESVVVRAKSAAAAARRSGRQPLATRWSTKRRPRRRRGPSSLA